MDALCIANTTLVLRSVAAAEVMHRILSGNGRKEGAALMRNALNALNW